MYACLCVIEDNTLEQIAYVAPANLHGGTTFPGLSETYLILLLNEASILFLTLSYLPVYMIT